MKAQMNGHANPHGTNGSTNRLAESGAFGLGPLEPSPTATESTRPAAADRDGRGRFTAGNRAGRGNPHARRMAALRQAFLSVATEDRMRELGEAMYAAAVAGDWHAAGLFLRFVIGRPSDAVDPDRVDLDEWQLRRDGPNFSDVLAAVGKIVAKDALGILQTMAEAQEPVRLLPADASQEDIAAAEEQGSVRLIPPDATPGDAEAATGAPAVSTSLAGAAAPCASAAAAARHQ
jgi:hypothetical protein